MSTSDVVDRALTLMKDLIGEHKDVMEVTYYPIKRFELSFYRNQVSDAFLGLSTCSVLTSPCPLILLGDSRLCERKLGLCGTLHARKARRYSADAAHGAQRAIGAMQLHFPSLA